VYRKYITSYVSSFDNCFKDIFSSIINCEVPDSAWNQASLDIKNGGFGIINLNEVSYSAQIASASDCYATLSRIFIHNDIKLTNWFYSIESAINHVNTMIDDEQLKLKFFTLKDSAKTNNIQQFLTSVQKSHFFKEFKNKNDNFLLSADKARFNSLSGEHAGDFLYAVGNIGNQAITNTEFSVMCCFRLGLDLPIISDNLRCNVCRDQPIFGEHSHVCPALGCRLIKHNKVVEVINSCTLAAGISSSTNMSNIFPASLTGKRPDLKLKNVVFQKGGFDNHVIDVQITHPCNKSYVESCAKGVLIAAKRSECAKTKKYSDLCNQNRLGFIPCIAESYGSLNEKFVNLIKFCASRQHERTKIPKSILTNFWFRKISITLQQANAQMIMSHVNGILFKQAERYSVHLPEKINSFNSFVNRTKIRD
jgi:hypothetical protein